MFLFIDNEAGRRVFGIVLLPSSVTVLSMDILFLHLCVCKRVRVESNIVSEFKGFMSEPSLSRNVAVVFLLAEDCNFIFHLTKIWLSNITSDLEF